MGKFRQFLKSYLLETRPYFRFGTITSANVNEFSPLGICIDIVDILIVIANWQILSIFYSYLPAAR